MTRRFVITITNSDGISTTRRARAPHTALRAMFATADLLEVTVKGKATAAARLNRGEKVETFALATNPSHVSLSEIVVS